MSAGPNPAVASSSRCISHALPPLRRATDAFMVSAAAKRPLTVASAASPSVAVLRTAEVSMAAKKPVKKVVKKVRPTPAPN